MNISWAADLHLDMADHRQRAAFYVEVPASQCEALLVGGDIANGSCLITCLQDLHDAVHCPVLFVLGNHDHWGRSIQDLRERVTVLAEGLPHLTYLSAAGVVALDEDTCVVGHDGWADGRYGDYTRSTVVLPDYVNIRDFVPLGKWPRLALMQQLGDAAAGHLRRVLELACTSHRRVVVVTHVPPFPQACLYRGDRSEADYLPHYSCQATGNVLVEAATQWPDREFLVLCGHTHEAVEVTVAANLIVRVAAAKYGWPRLAGKLHL